MRTSRRYTHEPHMARLHVHSTCTLYMYTIHIHYTCALYMYTIHVHYIHVHCTCTLYMHTQVQLEPGDRLVAELRYRRGERKRMGADHCASQGRGARQGARGHGPGASRHGREPGARGQGPGASHHGRGPGALGCSLHEAGTCRHACTHMHAHDPPACICSYVCMACAHVHAPMCMRPCACAHVHAPMCCR